MNITHLPAFEYQRMRWKNGLGWTREIAREPAGEGPFDWRLSIAEIDHDCDFSAFPGLRRSLVLLEGQGMRLDFADGTQTTLQPPHGRVDFSGDAALHCHLLDGPTRDFNLIWNPQRVDATVHHRPLAGSMVFFVGPGREWAIYVLSGQATVDASTNRVSLAPGDSLRLRAEASGRAILEGAGELLAVQINRLTAE